MQIASIQEERYIINTQENKSSEQVKKYAQGHELLNDRNRIENHV